MKELYLGLAISAFIVLVLTISVEVSTTGSYLNTRNTRNTRNNNLNRKVRPTIATNVNETNLGNTLPERVYNKNNLNKFFLEKYYENVNYNPKNNFYLPN